MRFLIASAILTAGLASADNRAPRITGKLHTENMQIVDARGGGVLLVGVSVSGMEYGAGKPWTAGGCEDIRNGRHFGCYSARNGDPDEECRRLEAWGLNSVRVPVSWANLEPTRPTRVGKKLSHVYNAAYLAALDDLISRLARHHLAVILSMHQWAWSPALHPEGKNAETMNHGCGLPVWLYEEGGYDQLRARHEFFTNRQTVLPGYSVQEGMADAWSMLAAHYRDNPAVIGADLFNEPYSHMEGQPHGPPDYTLDGLYVRLARAVHQADPALLLIFEDDGRGVTRRPADLPNVVVSYHAYFRDWDARAEEKLQKHLDLARRWNAPLWIGEFASSLPRETEAMELALSAMLDQCRRNGVGWAYWAYSRASRPLVGDGGGAGDPNLRVIRALRAGL